MCGATSATEKKTATLFMNNRNQAVRLPKAFRFETKQVWIRREGEAVILTPKYLDWSAFLDSDLVASPDFMRNVETLWSQRD